MKRGILSMAAVSALVIGNLSLVIGGCYAGVPRMMNYQGKLTGAAGNLVANGQYGMKFAMYDAETGGALKWTETWEAPANAVQVTNGLFNVPLGSTTAIGLDFGENYWLEIQVKDGGTYETLFPRQQLASTGYAFRAEKVSDGAITNASISASAAISDTKLATILTAGKVSGSAVNGGTLGAVNGGAITALSASNISSGTLGASYLPADGYASTYVNVGGDTMSGSLGLSSNGLAVGTSQLVVSGGNVGIGTVSPATKFHIVDTNGGIFFDGSVAEYNRMKSTSVEPASGKDLLFCAQNSGVTPDLYIKSNGKVGIGTTMPDGKVDIRGSTYIDSHFIQYTAYTLLSPSSHKDFTVSSSESSQVYFIEALLMGDWNTGVSGAYVNRALIQVAAYAGAIYIENIQVTPWSDIYHSWDILAGTGTGIVIRVNNLHTTATTRGHVILKIHTGIGGTNGMTIS